MKMLSTSQYGKEMKKAKYKMVQTIYYILCKKERNKYTFTVGSIFKGFTRN